MKAKSAKLLDVIKGSKQFVIPIYRHRELVLKKSEANWKKSRFGVWNWIRNLNLHREKSFTVTDWSGLCGRGAGQHPGQERVHEIVGTGSAGWRSELAAIGLREVDNCIKSTTAHFATVAYMVSRRSRRFSQIYRWKICAIDLRKSARSAGDWPWHNPWAATAPKDVELVILSQETISKRNTWVCCRSIRTFVAAAIQKSF